ncbi:MAG: hypothetical protein B9S33_06960 [Pedosphaera sp. Tous-C6FEB]|nr:MAG: hypothetical protein B9S33_06960 [Pedosphaera sp. Tous-C6FEB]
MTKETQIANGERVAGHDRQELSSFILRHLAGLAALTLLVACATPQTPAERTAAAKALFDRTVKEFHLPSAEAKSPERERLQAEAERGYTQVLREFRDQPVWGAQAQRSLGNLRAAQGRVDEAVKLFAVVERKFPAQEWEILQSWKSAADLLWEAKRPVEAKVYYQKIVTRFDQPEATALVKTIVRGSKARLREE